VERGRETKSERENEEREGWIEEEREREDREGREGEKKRKMEWERGG